MLQQHLNVSASLWSADLGDLRAHMLAVEDYCDAFHFDIMDGHYVPNLLFGPDHIRSLRPYARKPFEIHLMVEHPDSMLDLFFDCGDTFIVHRATCRHWPALRDRLKQAGKQVGLALRVEDVWQDVREDLPYLDVILIMGTAIGVKGVSIQPDVYRTIQEVAAYAQEYGLTTVVQADGGIREDSVPRLKQAGVTRITAGSLLFGQDYAQFRAWLQTL